MEYKFVFISLFDVFLIFQNAMAMFAYMTDIRTVEKLETQEIEAEGLCCILGGGGGTKTFYGGLPPKPKLIMFCALTQTCHFFL